MSQGSRRVASIDVMRGVVILLMMLDHVRERFYMHVRTGDPIHDYIEPDLFFTRLLTHLCAPIFIFLAGLGAWLYAHPNAGAYRSPTGFLLKRGLVIILIELVLYYLLWVDSYPNFMFLQVLFAIGACMLGLALTSRLNYWLVGALGFVIVIGHNGLDFIDFERGEWGYVAWTILHDRGVVGELGPLTVSLSYPVLPWFGVIMLGYFAGPLYAKTTASSERRKTLLSIGALCLLSLLVLRGFNIYGEAIPWSVRDTGVQTVMSFLNFTKYPPSLDYLLLTLGIGMLGLGWLETVKSSNRVLEFFQAFGSVPLFLYVLHLYVLLAAYWVLYLIVGPTHGERFGLPSVPWIWFAAALLIAAHYPIARAFSKFKHREKAQRPWLSYF
ncbi:MAG: heparan-alpha-glucosaminide N-acetyltransferase domain-containing protein [Pseudomonadota bacterium]